MDAPAKRSDRAANVKPSVQDRHNPPPLLPGLVAAFLRGSQTGLSAVPSRFRSTFLSKTRNQQANQRACIRSDEREDGQQDRDERFPKFVIPGGNSVNSRTCYQSDRAQDRPATFPGDSGVTRRCGLFRAFQCRRWQIAHELGCASMVNAIGQGWKEESRPPSGFRRNRSRGQASVSARKLEEVHGRGVAVFGHCGDGSQ